MLDDLLSGDEKRIGVATSAIIKSRDPEALWFLAAMRDEIEAATSGLDLGEHYDSTGKHLEFALEKLAFFASRAGCLCQMYPQVFPKYRHFDPEVERAEGHVCIVHMKTFDADRPLHYVCECVDCGTRYHVQKSYDEWEWASNESLLADLLCDNGTRVSSATHTIAKTRDEETLSFFVAKRGEIEAATNGLELWHRGNLETVLEKLTFFESRAGCWCAWYPRYGRFYPETERDEGHVSIVHKGDDYWFERPYICQCVNCGTRYDVVENTDLHTASCKWTTKESVLADLLSRHDNRIRMATREIIKTRDADLLSVLAAKRDEIEAATNGLEFAMMPWLRGHLTFALEKLSFFASRGGCFCQLYPRHDGFNPQVESIEGHVSIVQKAESTVAGEWPHYDCKCVDCGARYDIVHEHQRDSNAGWQWTLREPRWRFWRSR